MLPVFFGFLNDLIAAIKFRIVNFFVIILEILKLKKNIQNIVCFNEIVLKLLFKINNF